RSLNAHGKQKKAEPRVGNVDTVGHYFVSRGAPIHHWDRLGDTSVVPSRHSLHVRSLPPRKVSANTGEVKTGEATLLNAKHFSV
ncbi:hypothetical protein BaRGS_00004167, partial [Batillaria attramentaria]